MRCLVVLSVFLNLLTVSLSSPVKDESLKISDPAHRWTLIPDSSGKMHLVDFDSYDVQVEASFVPANDVVFLLFTRRNPTVGQIITFDPATLQNSNFNSNHPTRFSVHGWQGHAGLFTNTVVLEAFFAIGDFNVSFACFKTFFLLIFRLQRSS